LFMKSENPSGKVFFERVWNTAGGYFEPHQ